VGPVLVDGRTAADGECSSRAGEYELLQTLVDRGIENVL
jgi:hypothetical protein